mgnify:CR=1 FL=1
MVGSSGQVSHAGTPSLHVANASSAPSEQLTSDGSHASDAPNGATGLVNLVVAAAATATHASTATKAARSTGWACRIVDGGRDAAAASGRR